MLELLCTEAQCSPAVRLAQLLTSIFLAILFLQSGADKVLDRKGNLEWLTGHFAQSPLAGVVPLMLSVVTVTELSAGALAAAGAVTLILWQYEGLALAGVALSAISLIMLFFGQRMAKEYEGAAVIAPYFTLTILGLYLFR